MPALAGIAAIIGTGVSVAGAAGAFNPSAPDPLNYGQISRDAQQAQIDLLPAKTAASQTYDPQEAAVQQQINWNNLFGTPGGQRTVATPTPGFINQQTGEFVAGNTPPAWKPPSGLNAGFLGIQSPWVPYTQSTPQTVTDAATPGMLQMAQQALPAINSLSAQANTAARTATVGDVATLGPAAMAALKGFDPQGTGIADTLAGQAQDELNAGSRLTPSMQEQATNQIRAGQSARGMGYGPTDVFTEAMGLGQAGQQLLQQRQGFAQNVLAQRNQIYGDPFMAIANTSSGRNTSPTQFGTPATTSQTLASINPGTAPYSIAANNQAYQNQANIAGYNSQMQNIGALAGTNWGNVFGSVGKLFGTGNGSSSGALPTYGAGGMAY